MIRRSVDILCRKRGLSRFLAGTNLKQARPLSTTYYDSQSGMHVPIHNENEIRLFLNGSDELLIPPHLYKNNDEADEMKDVLHELMGKGVHGLFVPPSVFPRDVRNLKTLLAVAPAEFYLVSGDASSDEIGRSSDNRFLSQLVHFQHDAESDLQKVVQDKLHSTLLITEDVYMSDSETIVLANSIASLIDSTGGCDFIRLAAKRDDCIFEAIAICEELLYLDVTGPTIKSRLIIESNIEDILEEAMFAGVNKFMIDREGDIEIIENIAAGQGKAIVKQ